MESLRRPVVFQGITYSDYEMDFYTSSIYGKLFKDRRPLKFSVDGKGYQSIKLYPEKKNARIHKILAETFQDLLPKSPLVSYFDLQIGRNQYELKTPTGFTFLCNQVCPDHIDANRINNDYTNLMIVTQYENHIKCGVREKSRSKYKGVKTLVEKNGYTFYVSSIRFENILDGNGKYIRIEKRFKTEEEAALAYNKMLEEAMLTIWGPDLGPKMYDFAYKNTINTTVQKELILD